MRHSYTNDETKQKITRDLANLPRPIDPDAVDSVIGNTSWTGIRCGGCKRYLTDLDEPLVTVGETPDYESDTAELCVPCLEEALEVAKKHVDKNPTKS
jgi:hypothetical protein